MLKCPQKPIPPPKHFGGEWVRSIDFEDSWEYKIPILNQDEYDYHLDIDDVYGDHKIVEKTKQVENPDFKKQKAAYDLALKQYKIDKKAWDAQERERKKKERVEKDTKQKDEEFQLFLKLQKKYKNK